MQEIKEKPEKDRQLVKRRESENTVGGQNAKPGDF